MLIVKEFKVNGKPLSSFIAVEVTGPIGTMGTLNWNVVVSFDYSLNLPAILRDRIHVVEMMGGKQWE